MSRLVGHIGYPSSAPESEIVGRVDVKTVDHKLVKHRMMKDGSELKAPICFHAFHFTSAVESVGEAVDNERFCGDDKIGRQATCCFERRRWTCRFEQNS